MKKIVLSFLTVLLLSGCGSRFFTSEYVEKLIALGYSEEFGEVIDKYSTKTKELILNNDYNAELEKLSRLNDMSEDLLIEYLNSDYSYEDFIFVKKNINESNKDLFNELHKDKYFIVKNTNLYFKYINQFEDTRSLIEYVNTKAYKTQYKNTLKSDTTKGIFIIGSKIYYLGDYEPDDLEDLDDGYYMLTVPKLRAEAKTAYQKMADDARKEEVYFYVSTAYRSFDFQNTLYQKYLAADTVENVDTYSSRPGYSDHQTGLACDIRTENQVFSAFTNTKEEMWLKENAYKYGFIIRYPKDKQEITGYIPESWHYRYVGLDAAKEIYENQITFDEYYAYYIENK